MAALDATALGDAPPPTSPPPPPPPLAMPTPKSSRGAHLRNQPPCWLAPVAELERMGHLQAAAQYLAVPQKLDGERLFFSFGLIFAQIWLFFE